MCKTTVRWALLSLLVVISSIPAAAQTCVQPISGIIAWWPFDETSGTIANDIIGPKPGVYFDGPTPAAGKVGGSLQFDSPDDFSGSFVGIGDSDQWAFGAGNFTVELWTNFDTTGGGSIGHPGDIFIGNDEGPGTQNKWFFALGGGVLNFHINGPSTGSLFLVQAPFTPTVGQWYHLAVTKSGGIYTIFVNGNSVGSETNTAVIPNPVAPLTIGQAESLGFMNGRLDEVTIYNRALTQLELQRIVNAGSAGKCKPITTATISPAKGGNTGSVSVSIAGSGFSLGSTVRLVRSGNPDIVGSPVSVPEDGKTIATTFDLTGKARGLWDVVIRNSNGTSKTIPRGFTIEEGRAAQVWVDVVGRGAIRAGRAQKFSILYGNRGNVDAIGVPLWIAGIPKDTSSKLNFEITEPPPLPGVNWKAIPTQITIGNQIVIPLFLSSIPPNFTGALEIELTIPPTVGQFQLRAWTNLPFFSSSLSSVASLSLVDSPLVKCILEGAKQLLGGVIPGFDCIFAVIEFLREFTSGSSPRIGSLSQILFGVFKVIINCVGAFIPFDDVLDFLLFFLGQWLGSGELFEACFGSFLPQSGADLPVQVVTSFDPNDKVGSLGEDEEHSISGKEPLRYVIYFENVSTATAPAQEVIVTDQLDTAKVDVSTLSLGPITFGETIVTLPPGLSAFSTVVDLRPDKNLLVRIEASLDQATGLLTWHFTSLDPLTQELPEDPFAGFLPPNITPPEGDGSVLFTVMPKQGLPTGTEIRNQAQIVFDVNPPINTPEWLNTLDNTQPTSRVLPLAATQTSTSFLVKWSGTDVGVGIQDYTIFVAENGGPFTKWLSNTPDTSGTFPGQAGKTYAFYSIAKDRTGNLEDAPQAADTTTTVIVDLCPRDPNKTVPGICGCGIADTDSAGAELACATLNITDVTRVEGNNGTTNYVFTVILSNPSASPVTVNYVTANGTAIAGSDYTATNGTLTFTPRQRRKTVIIAVKGDLLVEPNETFFVNLSAPRGATIADRQGVGTIQNDDNTALRINDVRRAESNAGTRAFTFTVTLSQASASPVTVKYATANSTAIAPGDYTAIPSTPLTFAPGQTSKTVMVNVSGNTAVEPNENFRVNLSTPNGATIADGQGVGTILNDDGPVLRINDVSRAEGNSGITAFTFIVTLSPASASTVTVNYATANSSALAGSDYTAKTGTLTFTSGQTSKLVTVNVLGNTIVEPNENFRINLSSAVGATIFDGQGVGTILNDDGPTLRINNVSLMEGNVGTKNFVFTITLSSAAVSNVTVNCVTANGTAIAPGDYTAVNIPLTFTPGQTRKLCTVPVIGNTVVEPNEFFTANLTNVVGPATIFTRQGRGTILSDD